jgi:hypothetical protein
MLICLLGLGFAVGRVFFYSTLKVAVKIATTFVCIINLSLSHTEKVFLLLAEQ